MPKSRTKLRKIAVLNSLRLKSGARRKKIIVMNFDPHAAINAVVQASLQTPTKVEGI